MDNNTGLYYFNARYYSPGIGRFISVDPAKDGLNWYIYCGNNPLKRIDPTGLDFILLNVIDAASGHGHNGGLISTSSGKWVYYSKDGGSGSKGNKVRVYDTIKEFSQSKDGQRYDRGYRVKTTPQQDKKMLEYGRKNYKKPYHIKEKKDPKTKENKQENCADLQARIGKAGGLKINKPKDTHTQAGITIGPFTDPNDQYDEFKNDNQGTEITF